MGDNYIDQVLRVKDSISNSNVDNLHNKNRDSKENKESIIIQRTG